MIKYLENDEKMARISKVFSKRSGCVFRGSFSAINGWLVYIQRHTLRDDIKTLLDYYPGEKLYIVY